MTTIVLFPCRRCGQTFDVNDHPWPVCSGSNFSLPCAPPGGAFKPARDELLWAFAVITSPPEEREGIYQTAVETLDDDLRDQIRGLVVWFQILYGLLGANSEKMCYALNALSDSDDPLTCEDVEQYVKNWTQYLASSA